MNTYCFHTYSKINREDLVLEIEALDEESAWTIFEAKYTGYYVDMVTLNGNPQW